MALAAISGLQSTSAASRGRSAAVAIRTIGYLWLWSVAVRGYVAAMMATLFAAHLVSLGLTVFCVMIAFIAIEMVAPRVPVSRDSRLRAVAMWCGYIAVTSILLTAVDMIIPTLPSLPALPIKGFWGALATGLVGLVLTDFLIYWCHRAQHRWFWRSHAVHHSLQELSATSSYIHWTEQLFRSVLVLVPVALLTPRGPQLALFTVLPAALSAYVHANIRFRFSFLRKALVDPQYHRIHHSLEPKHFDKNFAAFLPLWDIVFGTAYFPQQDEWPATGLDDESEPDGLVDYLIRPFRPLARQWFNPVRTGR